MKLHEARAAVGLSSMPAARPVALVLFLLVAGCAAPSALETESAALPPVADDWWLHSLPSQLTHEDHDHSDRAQHLGLTTPNFEVVGWDPLVSDHLGTTPTGMGCGGAVAREDGRTLAIVHSIDTDVSFIVADVTDPAAPTKLGEFYMPNAIVWDADITADGMHVVIAADPWFLRRSEIVPVLPVGEPPALRLEYRSCTGEVRDVGPVNYVPFGPGLVLVGIQDPMAPVFEDWVPQPLVGPHGVSSAMVDGHVYVTSAVTNLVHEASYYHLFEVVDGPLGPRLETLSVLQAPGHPGVGLAALNGHVDAVIAKRPDTGQVLLYLANWDAYYIYDFDDPRAPRLLSTYLAEGAAHTSYPLPFMWGDRHFVIHGQEVGEPEALPSGWIYIVDDTDPTAPFEVGRWTIPVKAKWDPRALTFSPHYVTVKDTTLFVTNYHGGIWAVDISDPATPTTIGHFMPERASPKPHAKQVGPAIEDVILRDDGLLTTWDLGGGVYTLRFLPDVPVPPAPRWPGSEPR